MPAPRLMPLIIQDTGPSTRVQHQLKRISRAYDITCHNTRRLLFLPFTAAVEKFHSIKPPEKREGGRYATIKAKIGQDQGGPKTLVMIEQG